MFRRANFILRIALFCIALSLGLAPKLVAGDDTPKADDVADLRAAIRGCDQAIRLFPNASWLHWMRGLAEQRIGEESKALGDFQEALRLDPKAVRVYMDRASFYVKKRLFDTALADYNAALAVDPQNADLFALRAVAWDAKLDRNQAISDLNNAIGLKPQVDAFYCARAFCWIMKHEPDKALADASKALELSPRCDSGLRARALAWMAKGDYERAIADFDEILKRNPGDRLQLLYRSGLHYVRGDYANALADLRSTSVRFPDTEKWLQVAAASREGTSFPGKATLTAERKRRMLLGEFNMLDKAIDSDVHLDSQGLIDFVRANNDHCSRGVTPQNNAAVLLFEAFGPVATPWTESDDYYRMLQMRQPPKKGSYLVTLANCEVQNDKRPRPGILDHPASAEAWKPFALAMERPWAKDEYPRLAKCITANRIPLAKIVDASHRSKYYLPVIDTCHDLPALCISLSEISHLKEAVQLLAARAMLNLGEGNVDDAWQDTVAIFRLSRLAAQGPSVADFLFGIWLHERACRLTASIAHYGKLTEDRCGLFREDLRQLPKFPPVGDHIRYGERYLFLDIAQRSARLGPLGLYLAFNAVSQLSFDPVKGETPQNGGRPYVTIWFYNESVDWDEVMRLGNARFEAAARIFEQTREKRNAARDAFVADFLSESQKFDQTGAFKQWSSYIMFTGIIPRQVTSADFAQCCVRLAMPAPEVLCDAEDRCRVDARITEIALALAAFRSDHGAYPQRLAELAPKYLSTVPKDPFTGSDLHYSSRGEGYELYSVGPNQKDDGGRDRNDSPPGDDIVIRMPPTKAGQK